MGRWGWREEKAHTAVTASVFVGAVESRWSADPTVAGRIGRVWTAIGGHVVVVVVVECSPSRLVCWGKRGRMGSVADGPLGSVPRVVRRDTEGEREGERFASEEEEEEEEKERVVRRSVVVQYK